MIQILPQLTDIIEAWPDNEEFEYNKMMGLRLVEGMKEAIEEDVQLEFM